MNLQAKNCLSEFRDFLEGKKEVPYTDIVITLSKTVDNFLCLILHKMFPNSEPSFSTVVAKTTQ